jgi:GTPase involved in cell partitioning and DNA repair
MKKYTVYEIEKLTKGKLSKYKLNQAIEKGDLIAEEVKSDKRGKGIPKYFIFEDSLQNYLNKIEANRKRLIEVPDDTKNTNNFNEEMKNFIQTLIAENNMVVQSQKSELEQLRKQIKLLEAQTDKLSPYLDLDKHNSEEQKSKERRELLMELANMSVFAFRRKNEVLKKLSSLA